MNPRFLGNHLSPVSRVGIGSFSVVDMSAEKGHAVIAARAANGQRTIVIMHCDVCRCDTDHIARNCPRVAAERDRLAAAERNRLAAAERDRLAAAEREREREREQIELATALSLSAAERAAATRSVRAAPVPSVPDADNSQQLHLQIQQLQLQLQQLQLQQLQQQVHGQIQPTATIATATTVARDDVAYAPTTTGGSPCIFCGQRDHQWLTCRRRCQGNTRSGQCTLQSGHSDSCVHLETD